MYLSKEHKNIIRCLLSERVTELKYSDTRNEDAYKELIYLLAIFSEQLGKVHEYR